VYLFESGDTACKTENCHCWLYGAVFRISLTVELACG